MPLAGLGRVSSPIAAGLKAQPILVVPIVSDYAIAGRIFGVERSTTGLLIIDRSTTGKIRLDKLIIGLAAIDRATSGRAGPERSTDGHAH